MPCLYFAQIATYRHENKIPCANLKALLKFVVDNSPNSENIKMEAIDTLEVDQYSLKGQNGDEH